MNINTGLNPYNNSNYVNNATDVSRVGQGQSLTGSVTDGLREGDIFEGSVNSIENGKVTIGLANGQTMTARLDSGVSLTPGQSIFFEVKSNDGSLVQIRPVSLNNLNANPTLLKALDMANIAVNERTINMVNFMMQNSLSVSPENLASMNRAMINNPDVDIQTLVTMSKQGIDLSSSNINMYQNYTNDKALLTDNFDTISKMLPELMESDDVSALDIININNEIKNIFLDATKNLASNLNPIIDEISLETSPINDLESNNVTVGNNIQNQNIEGSFEESIILERTNNTAEGILPNNTDGFSTDKNLDYNISSQFGDNNSITEAEESLLGIKQASIDGEVVNNSEFGLNTINNFATKDQIDSFNTTLSNIPDFPKDNSMIFNENGILRTDADINQLFREITEYINNHSELPKETLNNIVKEPLYSGLLKSIISNSFSIDAKDVTKPGEISKLYEKVLKQTEAIERLVSNFSNKAADSIKNQTNDIKQNINFMNSANEMYNFVQIPLKMYNQNTDSMLYVKQNKKNSYAAGEEITAFLHFDMEHLGSTDVFVTLQESKVGCNWNLASVESMQLIEDNLDILTQRLNSKGFSVTSSVKCSEEKESFVKDFWGANSFAETSADGLVHRYSFDMRA